MKPYRFFLQYFLALVLSLAAASASATTLNLGLGFDRAHDGHGFDLHKIGDTYILFFYTYDAAGDPEWYLGTSELNGGKLSGDLLRFTYDAADSPPQTLDGNSAATFSLNFDTTGNEAACQDGVDRSSAEQLSLFHWEINGQSGTWCTEFLRFGSQPGSGPYLGGVWFAGNDDPGYGFTLSHMDDTVVSIFYYYDQQGQPRWALGIGGENDAAIKLDNFKGYCRVCTPRERVITPAGTLALTWDGVLAPGAGGDTAQARVSYPNPPFGDFDRDFTLHILSDSTPQAEVALPSEMENPQSFYDAYISGPIVQAKCIVCHVQGGVSGNTRLVFERSDQPDYKVHNLQTLRALIEQEPDRGNYVLSKVQGQLSHGGGVQLQAGSVEFANLEALFALMDKQPDQNAGGPEDAFFAGIGMLDAESTLRRAAMILAGRRPTEVESEAVANGDDQVLRATIRGLMQGANFHQFLIEGANDRLLTDKDMQFFGGPLSFFSIHYPDQVNTNADFAELFERTGERAEWDRYTRSIAYAGSRAPLELIAHVVEQDKPYTEILTADYTMVNPETNQAMAAGATFNNPDDVTEFQPGVTQNYLRSDDTLEVEATVSFVRVLSGGQATVFPYAGVLNTNAFLFRYPSTATNRNRARARWTYFHFLGFDIEKSAGRSLDPAVLADTNNPTLNNPNCTVCHQIHDPVAGTYQNYGDEGYYKVSADGQHSLPDDYLYPPDGSASLFRPGDTWYRDMRPPGFEGKLAPDSYDSLQWLAEQIVADPRFAEAAVKFWWPAIMGAELGEAPAENSDADFDALLARFVAQNSTIQSLAEGFAQGFGSHGPFNLKDLLVEMVMSPWFRASTASGLESERQVALADAGVGQLLTPSQLSRKTGSLTGYVWGRQKSPYIIPQDVDNLSTRFKLFYGGIDSDGTTRRARGMTPLMSEVPMGHALHAACPMVLKDFSLPDDKRHLFGGIEKSVTPVQEFSQEFTVNAASYAEREEVEIAGPLSSSDKKLQVRFLNDFSDQSLGDRNLILDKVRVLDSAGEQVAKFEFEDLASIPGASAECGERGNYSGSGAADAWNLWSNCLLEIPFSVPLQDNYRLITTVFAQQAGPDLAQMRFGVVDVDPMAGTSAGALQIKQKLLELHDTLLNEHLTLNDPELLASYQLFAETWLDRVASDKPTYIGVSESNEFCGFDDQELLSDFGYPGDEFRDRFQNFDGDRFGDLLYGGETINQEDPDHVLGTWITVMVYFLSDYRYLHE